MKKINLIILFLFAGTMIQSCKSIMMKINHIAEPGIVTEAQTISYLDKKKMGSYGSYFVCKDSSSLVKLIQAIKCVPETQFFGSGGELLIYGDSSCPGLAMEFGKSLKRDVRYKTDSSTNLNEILKLLKPVRASSVELPVDYTVIFYWATFAGNINNNVFEIAEEIKRNPRVNIRILFANVDFQESWGMQGQISK